MSDKKWWDKWCKQTPLKHEGKIEKDRPVETAVQKKLDKKKRR